MGSSKGTHTYDVELRWTGNLGEGTRRYTGYSRDHEIWAAGKPPLAGSSDPAFHGDPTRYNPEELLVASLSACHMLWYLHLCANAGICVTAYADSATGRMQENRDGGGRFTEVVLAPRVQIAPGGDAALAERLHSRAHELCFVASSVNFPVLCQPMVAVEHTVGSATEATSPLPPRRHQ